MLTAIMIDTNELATAPWLNKLTFGGVPKMPANLEYGDILATTDTGDLICIERKTPTDLLNSIKDKHIFYQAAGMRDKSPWSYIVVTGILRPVGCNVMTDSGVTGWGWNSLQGALREIQEMGVVIIYCLGDEEYEATVLGLCNRDLSKEKVLQPAMRSREMSYGEIMLTSLPGIGIERANTLLCLFNYNPAKALSWLTHKQSTINAQGFGDGIKRSVKSALSLGEYEELFIVNSAHYPEIAEYLHNAEEIEGELNK